MRKRDTSHAHADQLAPIAIASAAIWYHYSNNWYFASERVNCPKCDASIIMDGQRECSGE